MSFDNIIEQYCKNNQLIQLFLSSIDNNKAKYCLYLRLQGL